MSETSPSPEPDVHTLAVSSLERRLILGKRRVLDAAKVRVAAARGRTPAAPVTPTPHPEPAPAPVGPPPAFELDIAEFSYYREVLHVEGHVRSAEVVTGVGHRTTGGDVVRAARFAGDARDVRLGFAFDVVQPDRQAAATTTLVVEFASHAEADVPDVAQRALAGNPVRALNLRFQDAVRAVPAPRVLEVGARARSGNVYRSWLPEGATYVGTDIVDGENVDAVGDAHRLSQFLPVDSFDAAYSVSTMEHLAMPWVAAVEMNRVLKPGGVAYVATHQTWPVHDAPWDFYRFSEYSWHTLFNRYSGFEILEVAAGEPGHVVAHVVHPPTNGLELQPAFLSTAVLARKTGPTDLVWAADAGAVVAGAYPG